MSLWEARDGQGHRRGQSGTNRKMRIYSDIAWPFRCSILFRLVANGPDVVGSGRFPELTCVAKLAHYWIGGYLGE
jgi:hypothetical protein